MMSYLDSHTQLLLEPVEQKDFHRFISGAGQGSEHSIGFKQAEKQETERNGMFLPKCPLFCLQEGLD